MRMNNRTFGITLAAVAVGMVGVSFAAIPLYRVFCSFTGYAGTPQIGASVAPGATRHLITVRFNANTNPNLPWDFAPVQEEIRLPLGEEQLAFYTARNVAQTPITGVALYNVTPDTVGKYFHKTACFCFNQQTLAAGEFEGISAQLLGRSRDRQGSQHGRHRHDHAVLHVLPHARGRGKGRRTGAGRAACRPVDAADPLNRRANWG